MAEITQEIALIDLDRLDLEVRPVPGAAVVAYLARLAPGSRRTMAQALRFIAEDFSKGILTADAFPWERLRYQHTQLIRARLAERYAYNTANKMLVALRGVLTECWRLGLIHVEEMRRASDLKQVRGERQPRGRALTAREVEALVANALTHRHKALIRFLVTTGLRREEAARLTYADFNNNCVLVRGKGNKDRIVPVPPVATDLPYVGTTGDQRVFGMSASAIYQAVRQAGFSAGLAVVTPHDLRRTYITRLLAAGVDLPTVQRLVGHASPTTTARYDRRGIEEATAAVNRVFA